MMTFFKFLILAIIVFSISVFLFGCNTISQREHQLSLELQKCQMAYDLRTIQVEEMEQGLGGQRYLKLDDETHCGE